MIVPVTNEKLLSRIQRWLLSSTAALLTLTLGIISGVYSVVTNLAVELVPKSWPITSNAYLLGATGIGLVVLAAVIEYVRRKLNPSESNERPKMPNAGTQATASIGRDNRGTVIQAAGGTVNYYGSVVPNHIAGQSDDNRHSSDAGAATRTRPPRANAHFVGRNRELKKLEQVLSGKSGALVAIHGLGGVGKTQLALKYVSEHSGGYKNVWWIPCDRVPLIAE
jgi:hypothetical protein